MLEIQVLLGKNDLHNVVQFFFPSFCMHSHSKIFIASIFFLPIQTQLKQKLKFMWKIFRRLKKSSKRMRIHIKRRYNAAI